MSWRPFPLPPILLYPRLSLPLPHIQLTSAIHQVKNFQTYFPQISSKTSLVHQLWRNLHRKPISGKRVRLIPATPRQELPTPSSLSSSTTNSTQSSDTSSSDLRAGNPRGIMRRVKPTVEMPYPFTYQAADIRSEEFPPSAPTSPTSSSSLGFSDGQTFENIAFEVIREMREAKEREKEKSKEGQGTGHPLKISAEAAIRDPQENHVKEVHDLTGTYEEGEAASDDWKSQMENTVNLLIVENAEQNAMLKAQGEQLTKVVNLVDRVISYMDRETQSSNQPTFTGYHCSWTGCTPAE